MNNYHSEGLGSMNLAKLSCYAFLLLWALPVGSFVVTPNFVGSRGVNHQQFRSRRLLQQINDNDSDSKPASDKETVDKEVQEALELARRAIEFADVGSSASTTTTATTTTAEDKKSDDSNSPADDLEIQLLQSKVARVNNRLTQAERRSTQQRTEWMRERTELVHKVSSLKAMLNDVYTVPEEKNDAVAALELELDMAHEHETDLLQEQDRLEREVVLLQGEILQLRNLQKTVEYRSMDLEEELDELQEAQESTNMNWEIKVETQAREIEALKSKMQCMEQQQHHIHEYSVRNETMSLS